MWSVTFAEWLMKLLPANPDPRSTYFYVARLGHEVPKEIAELLLREANAKYEHEGRQPWLSLNFPPWVRDLLIGRVLDLGCSVGGRTVRIAETFRNTKVLGVDILAADTATALHFATTRRVPTEFCACRAEALPLAPASIDTIVSYDTFEHVESVERTLLECYRVLKPGGHLIAVFPPFLSPLESHLLFTRVPAIHWFIPGAVLAEAQRRTALKRGWPEILPPLESWERLPSLNGVNPATFFGSAAGQGWQLVYGTSTPLFTTGQRAQSWPFPFLRLLCRPILRIPRLRDYATDRIACVLRKPDVLTESVDRAAA
jgi:SAM-dependent methyltransferase